MTIRYGLIQILEATLLFVELIWWRFQGPPAKSNFLAAVESIISFYTCVRKPKFVKNYSPYSRSMYFFMELKFSTVSGTIRTED